MSSVKERLLKYVKFDTTSDPKSETCPSTEKQKRLGQTLVEEMQAMGLEEVGMDENGYVYGKLSAQGISGQAPKLALIAHMDTSPDMSGRDVKPRIVSNYDGGKIVLNEALNIAMTPEMFPALELQKGKDLIVTDGTTLLGADNKAGIAEILTLAEYLTSHPEVPHGPIRIAFTPDEEIGRGADLLNLERLDADFGYTVDGGELGELEYENFNAASVAVQIEGMNIHPGSAKGKMKNALLIAMELHGMLPGFETPAFTEHYEGFNHLNDLSGTVERAEMLYIVRDHDREKFEQKKKMFKSIEEFLNFKYGSGTVKLTITDSYYNMKEKILPHFHLIETAQKAMETVGVNPLIVPIRGGTDGARLSYMGLPCPNLFTGGQNFHGKYEYVAIQDMEKTVEVLKEIVKAYAQKA